MDTRKELKTLWKTCFGDSDEFVNLFFQKIYKPENCLYIAENGAIISAVYMLPYTMTWYGNVLPVGYIYAAATHPDYRNRGVMRKLLEQAFWKMKERGDFLTVLIPAEPWLFGYYEKSGYVASFSYSTETFRYTEHVDGTSILQITTFLHYPIEQVYSYFNRKMQERNLCMQHYFDDFKMLAGYLKEDRSEIFTIGSKTEICGLAFVREENGNPVVKELLSDNDIIRKQMLLHICKTYGKEEIVLELPASGRNRKTRGMAQIVNRETAIDLWASVFKKPDYFKEKLRNTGTKELTKLFLHSRDTQPYMSLMMD